MCFLKIGIYGIYGVYNFGCEAIVRGSYKFIKDLYPDSEIIYYSFSYAYDKERLNDIDIDIVPVEMQNSIIKRGINKIFRLLKIEKQYLMFDVDRIINDIDLLVSIGGDIYTIPQVMREREKYPYYNPLVDFCDKAIKKGKDVIVYGASVGPWGNYKKAIDYYMKALSKYKMILCREEETIGYLRSLGLKNVMFFPDPAFQIRSNLEFVPKKYIGINLSPLSIKELYGDFNDDYAAKLAVILDKLYKESRIELMFIPHVLSLDNMDNDLRLLEKIKNMMHYKDQVTVADTSKGFIGIKEYVCKCHVVVAARMHCAINAIDENIPAVFLSYSQKSIGMCKYIYGDDQFLIDLKNIENELIDKVVEILEHHDQISNKIIMRNNEIKQYYKTNIDRIKKTIVQESDISGNE